MTTQGDRYAADWLAKAQFARRSTERGEPWPAWSTGEILAVAVLLQDTRKLADLEYTEVEALQRLGSDIGMPDLTAAAQWFANLRARV